MKRFWSKVKKSKGNGCWTPAISNRHTKLLAHTKMKYSIGDLVIIPDRSIQTDIIADAMGEREDGNITRRELADLEDTLEQGKPLQVLSIEEDGYVLTIPDSKKGMTGIMEEEDLAPAKK